MVTKRKAGAFDIRVVIAALVGCYGIVLTILGLLASDADIAKSDGVNINLWGGGLAMLLFAATFLLWSRLRPIVVPEAPKDDPA